MTPRSATIGTLILAAATALSACGGASTTASTTATTQGGATSQGSATSQGVASGEPTPGGTAAKKGTKKDAGLSAAPTATVGQSEFCQSLKQAKFTPEDLTTFSETTRKGAVNEVVSRMDRLSQITPSSDIAPAWRDVENGFDTIANGASKASSDAQVAGIVKDGLAKAAPSRDKVLAAAKQCG